MDIVFVDTAEACNSSDLWHTIRQHNQLLTILHQASARASQLGSPILASFTQPVALHNPLHIFSALRQLQTGELFYWEQPGQQSAFIGLGTAASIESLGPECFDETISSWRALQHNAIIGLMHAPRRGAIYRPEDPIDRVEGGGERIGGPILFGGFAFDPLTTRTKLWACVP